MLSKLSLKIGCLTIISFLVLAGCNPSLERLEESYKKAIDYYQNAIQNNPTDLELKLRFANFCYKFRDYKRVIEILKGEMNVSAEELVAKSLVKLNRYTQALEIFEKIEKTLSPEGMYLYGLSLEKKNLFPKAVKIYKRVKPPYQELAEQRLKEIKVVKEVALPTYISQLVKDSQEFLRKVPDEAALVLQVKETKEITSSNTSTTTLHVIEKVLKERAKEDLAEVLINYDSTYERVELEFARSINKKGEIFYAGKENIRDVTKYLNFPLYSNIKVFIISIPGVEVGSIIEYKVKIYNSKLINKDDFNIFYRLREKYPIYKAYFDLIVPKERKVHFKIVNAEYAQGIDLAPQEKIEKNKKVYYWRFKEILPLIPEDNMPPYPCVNPTILMSSFDSWEEIYQWWEKLYKDKIQLTKQMQDFLNDLIKDEKTPLAKAKKIYEYVARDIRYVAVEYGESGYEPHYAKEVFVNRYGDCKDQAILLVALLRAAGFNAYPVLIPTQKAYALLKDFPALYFNHAICVLKLDNDLIFMDPTSSTTSFGDLPISDQGRDVLVFFDDGYKILTTPQLKDNRIVYKMEIEINSSEDADIKRKVITYGAYASYQRWYLKYTHPSKIKEDIQEKIVEISPFSKLIYYKIENVDRLDVEPILEYSFHTEKFLNPAEELRVISLSNQINLSYSLVGKEKRKFPIDFRGLFVKEAIIFIKLPSIFKVKFLPEGKSIDTKWFLFTTTYNYDPGKNIVRFTQNFTIKSRFVEVKDYNKFRKKLKEVFYLLREVIILAKDEDAQKIQKKRF